MNSTFCFGDVPSWLKGSRYLSNIPADIAAAGRTSGNARSPVAQMHSRPDVEWPHLIHATLIWQQPHPIYLAETLYRLFPTMETLDKWRDVVFATAEYMADFIQLDTLRGVYVLEPPLCPVSENTPIFETRNPTFELAYWRYGLQTAQIWL